MGSCLTKKNKNKLASYDPSKLHEVECFNDFSISNIEEFEPMEVTDNRSFVRRQFQDIMKHKIYFRRLGDKDY
jgi:hypothetical protein|tara:strand:- start:103 stop:321 length:219 start_codon:yes stop_codon:yes gene_type:complete